MKQRLDQLLFSRGLVSSRSQAESWIRLGKVFVAGKQVTKPGAFVDTEQDVELKTSEKYVSRAGLKLASVARILHLDFADKVMLDVGSSTGGFTDYALQHGIRKVVAVDVGTNQLHPSLLGNPRIELHEQTDIRSVILRSPNAGLAALRSPSGADSGGVAVPANPSLAQKDSRNTPVAGGTVGGAPVTRNESEHDGEASASDRTRLSAEPAGGSDTEESVRIEAPDLVVIDVSFISLRDILPHVATLCGPHTVIAAMVKPQFEARESNMKHKGVIKNDRMRRDILKDFEQWAAHYFVILDKADSDVAGSKGNRERFYKLCLSA